MIAPLQQMGVAEIIDQHVPVDEQAEFGHGEILSLLIAARVDSPVALSRVSAWALESGADVLWQIPADKLNDDRLGRALDAIYDVRHSLLSAIALRVAERYGVPLTEIHDDPTHVLFTGAYADAAARDGVDGVDGAGRCGRCGRDIAAAVDPQRCHARPGAHHEGACDGRRSERDEDDPCRAGRGGRRVRADAGVRTHD